MLTHFMRFFSLRMKREELDNPHKSNTWRYFGPDFAVQLDFSECNQTGVDGSST